MATDLPTIGFDTPADFESWLAEHHASCPDGIWLKFAKKDSGIPSINYQEALVVALCYGWIDGQAKPCNEDQRWLQRFTPRRPRSKWSKRNRGIVEKLIAEGRMQPAGQAQIDAAKADGRWEAAYDSPRTITVPDDLQVALDANPRAEEFFATLKGSNRYAILYRIQDAKRPETRAKRIAQFVKMLENGETIH